MLAEMSVVVVGGVGMKCIPRPRMYFASGGTSCCAVRSWRVELCCCFAGGGLFSGVH